MAEITWYSSQWLSPCPSSGMCLSPVESPSSTWRGWCRGPGTAWRSFPRLGLTASPLRLPLATLVETQLPCSHQPVHIVWMPTVLQLHSQTKLSPEHPRFVPSDTVSLPQSHCLLVPCLPVLSARPGLWLCTGRLLPGTGMDTCSACSRRALLQRQGPWKQGRTAPMSPCHS